LRPRPRRVHSPEYKLLTQHLKQARLHPPKGGKKITQVELARRLRLSQSYVYKVETAERELNVLELVDYCKALDIDVIEFIRHFLLELEELKPEVESHAE
jgi:transcriptional regulator with XRE-family HTH domain